VCTAQGWHFSSSGRSLILTGAPERSAAWASAALVVRFTSLIICLHILEILLWTAFYRWRCLGTWESAFYFSATSYSTVGYGDVVLQPVWRLLGPVEGLSGVLMCGLSASFLFAVVTRLVESSESAKNHR
jgi:voltage-gated potassium channel